MARRPKYPYTKQQLINVVKRIGKGIDPVNDYDMIDTCIHKCFNKDIVDDKKPIRGWHKRFVTGRGIAVEICRQMHRYMKAMRYPKI
jgi:hypothetical protein